MQSPTGEDSLRALLKPLYTDEDCFAAVGRLVLAYGSAEARLHETLRAFSGLADRDARVVFHGLRLADASEKLRGIISHNFEYNYSEIDVVLVHLSCIGAERGKIVHRQHIKNTNGMGISISNHLSAKTMNFEEDFYTLEDLLRMAFDCEKIAVRLQVLIECRKNPAFCADKMDRIRSPWLYTPRKRRGGR